jgi:hypothetical protein
VDGGAPAHEAPATFEDRTVEAKTIARKPLKDGPPPPVDATLASSAWPGPHTPNGTPAVIVRPVQPPPSGPSLAGITSAPNVSFIVPAPPVARGSSLARVVLSVVGTLAIASAVFIALERRLQAPPPPAAYPLVVAAELPPPAGPAPLPLATDGAPVSAPAPALAPPAHDKKKVVTRPTPRHVPSGGMREL